MADRNHSLLDPNLLHLSYGGLSACEGKRLASGKRGKRRPKDGAPVCYICALIADGLKEPNELAAGALEHKPCLSGSLPKLSKLKGGKK
jgi:hypothetical protein